MKVTEEKLEETFMKQVASGAPVHACARVPVLWITKNQGDSKGTVSSKAVTDCVTRAVAATEVHCNIC